MTLDEALSDELKALEAAGLRRVLREIQGPQTPHLRSEKDSSNFLQFASNDYLGLANDPVLREAAMHAVERYGVGSGAARLITGSLHPHHQLENALAAFKGVPAVLSFSSGYAAALGTFQALINSDDVVILDRLVHACLVDGARASGATLRVFDHNDLNHLEEILQWARREPNAEGKGRKPPRRVLIVTESVFSMDGDLAPLVDLVRLKDQYGAWLMVDEAHATGLFGEGRRGLIEAFGVSGRVEIQMGTLGKALGAAGGYIAGSSNLIELLIHRARSFVFSTAPSPVVAATAAAAVAWLATDAAEQRRQRLWDGVNLAKDRLIEAGWPIRPVQSPILPVLLGDEKRALELAQFLRERNVIIPAIRYPTVAKGQARLRVTVTASHQLQDFDRLGGVMREAAETWGRNNAEPVT